MFGGKHVNVTAVRRKSGEITFLEVPKEDKSWVKRLRKIPLIRGIVSIIDSSAKGSKHLNYSAEAMADDETEPEERAKQKEKESSGFSLTMIVGVAIAGVLSFLFGKVVFTLVPAVVEEFLFENAFDNRVLHTLVEGAIKIILLLVYLWAISQTPVIKRLFQYHGAEHKVITAYEHGEELTVQNVQKYSRLHYRCGSSFIILTVIVGVIIYSLFHWDNVWERMYIRLLLLPLVIGVSFELLRLTNAVRDIPVLRFLGYPGLWLQLLTTKEPKDDQVEVSIASFNRMRELDAQYEREGVLEQPAPNTAFDPVKG
ncbi:membrane protein [Paenibacillus woosongensis]|uniref:Membrane protein n=2 Tax=Paenibacillus TaxID=44249 RepID=A0ABQ4MQ68_9BACL|nr:membrane protein [Paenibacillus woosongensis]